MASAASPKVVFCHQDLASQQRQEGSAWRRGAGGVVRGEESLGVDAQRRRDDQPQDRKRDGIGTLDQRCREKRGSVCGSQKNEGGDPYYGTVRSAW